MTGEGASEGGPLAASPKTLEAIECGVSNAVDANTSCGSSSAEDDTEDDLDRLLSEEDADRLFLNVGEPSKSSSGDVGSGEVAGIRLDSASWPATEVDAVVPLACVEPLNKLSVFLLKRSCHGPRGLAACPPFACTRAACERFGLDPSRVAL